MPVTKSAKKALRTATRRHAENLIHKANYKNAVKSVKKAAEENSPEVPALFSKAQSALDRAAKNNTIHPNKAARLKSRLNKKLVAGIVAPAKKAARKRTAASTKAKSKAAL